MQLKPLFDPVKAILDAIEAPVERGDASFDVGRADLNVVRVGRDAVCGCIASPAIPPPALGGALDVTLGEQISCPRPAAAPRRPPPCDWRDPQNRHSDSRLYTFLPPLSRLSRGLTLGYRRCDGPGSWNTRVSDGGSVSIKRIGLADDIEAADGKRVLSFNQGCAEARRYVRTHVWKTERLPDTRKRARNVVLSNKDVFAFVAAEDTESLVLLRASCSEILALRNDVSEIKTQLTSVETHMTALESSVVHVRDRIDGVQKQLDKIGGGLGRIEPRLELRAADVE